MKELTCMLAVVLAMGLVASVSYADLEDGVVGYWQLDGNGDDRSGNGNNGTIIGDPATVDGMVGTALDFNGDDGVEIPDSPILRLPDAFTLACWIYPRGTRDAGGTDHAGVVWKGSMIGWGSDVYNYRIATADDAGITFGACGDGVESHFRDSNILVEFETWYHLAYTADGSIGIGYVNGETNADLSRADEITYDVLAGEPIRIGWSQGQGGNIDTLVYFDGIIDDVVLYDRALSAAEVSELMTESVPETAVEPTAKLATTWSSIKAD